MGWKVGHHREGWDVLNCYCWIAFQDSLSSKTFIVLHSVVHIKSDKSSCVKIEKLLHKVSVMVRVSVSESYKRIQPPIPLLERWFQMLLPDLTIILFEAYWSLEADYHIRKITKFLKRVVLKLLHLFKLLRKNGHKKLQRQLDKKEILAVWLWDFPMNYLWGSLMIFRWDILLILSFSC